MVTVELSFLQNFLFFSAKISKGASPVKDKSRYCVHYYVRKYKKEKHRSSKSYNKEVAVQGGCHSDKASGL